MLFLSRIILSGQYNYYTVSENRFLKVTKIILFGQYNSKEKSLKYIAWILSWAGKLVVLECTSENFKIILFGQYNSGKPYFWDSEIAKIILFGQYNFRT